jgi:glucose-1-phosphate cytidylyltransferase
MLWHVMKYYAHFGHADFILCLGYKGDAIKRYFLEYNEALSNDFVLSEGARRIDMLRKDIEDWRITFVDTGLNSNIGQRLMAVRRFVKGEAIFLANYSDGMTDLALPELIAEFKARKAIAMFLAARPHYSGHFVRRGPDGRVLSVDNVVKADAWINGGYFVFSNEIFDYMRPGEELVEEPFERLIAKGKLYARAYEGFWRAVDTFKDLQAMEALLAQGKAPWQVWLGGSAAAGEQAVQAQPGPKRIRPGKTPKKPD